MNIYGLCARRPRVTMLLHETTRSYPNKKRKLFRWIDFRVSSFKVVRII